MYKTDYKLLSDKNITGLLYKLTRHMAGKIMAETKGFEPLIPLRVCLISSQVHSTTLPRLRRAVLYRL